MIPTHYALHGNCAVIQFQNHSANSLTLEIRQALLDGLDRANADPKVKAIVLIGSADVFSAGADIEEFVAGNANTAPNLPALIEAIETSAKPVVAAIGKTCMGGGLELALACHGRVFHGDARISFPEIHLGLIPGAGGTQRLPRAVGLAQATSMVIGGQPVAVASLKDTALVSQLVDQASEGDLLGAALALADSYAQQGAPALLRHLSVKDADAGLYLRWVRNSVRPQSRTAPALLAAVDAIEASLGKQFEKGAAEEYRIFWSLMDSREARSLRHAFLAERQCGKVPGLSTEASKAADAITINKVGIVGAGTMGSGIAMNFLNAGIAVVLVEQKDEALQRGVKQIRQTYEGMVAKGRLSADKCAQRLALLTPSLDDQALADVDLAVEAVFEDMAVKTAVLTRLGQLVRPEAIIASNTSTLDLNQLALNCPNPERVVGLHFFSPAHVMKLLEVVRGECTSDAVLAASMKLAKRIGKVAVVSGVCDGFIGNRMLNEYLRIAALVVEQGASPWQVDKALEQWGMAMGPFRMMDMAGNDIGWAIRKRIMAEKPQVRFSPIPDLICEAGRMGQKTGKGWYDYSSGQRGGAPDAAVDQLISEARSQAGINPRRFSDQDIVQRCLYALVNEGARILQEGIALRAGDIDVVYLNGYGFPRHRGGPMHYASEQGLFGVARAMARFAAEPGGDSDFWQPAACLTELASTGQRFNEYKAEFQGRTA